MFFPSNSTYCFHSHGDIPWQDHSYGATVVPGKYHSPPQETFPSQTVPKTVQNPLLIAHLWNWRESSKSDCISQKAATGSTALTLPLSHRSPSRIKVLDQVLGSAWVEWKESTLPFMIAVISQQISHDSWKGRSGFNAQKQDRSNSSLQC